MILNKADLVVQGEADCVATELMGALSWTGPWYVISAATGEGCASLTRDIFSWIDKAQQNGSSAMNGGSQTTMGGQGRERAP